MSAKDPPIARRALTLEQLRAFADKFVRDCTCEPYQSCPVCTAKRGQSVPHDDEGE